MPLAVCLLGFVQARGQVSQPDSAVLSQSLQKTLTYFNTAIGEQSLLYNGSEYLYYDPVIKGNAGFMDIAKWQPGSVNYNGGSYQGVPMMYDLNTDQLVVLLYNKFSPFYLIPDKVEDFDLNGHHFISLRDSLAGIDKGYYEQWYGGKSKVLVKWVKSIQNATTTTGLETYFQEKHQYYIKKGNVYQPVSSEGDIVSVFKDRKKDIRQYISANKIRYRSDPKEAMVSIASYYDQITK